MKKEEFAKLAMALQTYYPRENLIPNKEALDLWFFQLQDIPYQIAELSLNKWVATNKWSPTIADIREMASSISMGEIPDWGEAWEEVRLAMRRFGSYQPQEALESMSPLTRQATERIGFINMCKGENPSADRANFRIVYEQLAERKKKESQIPLQIKNLISQIQTNGIEEKSDE